MASQRGITGIFPLGRPAFIKISPQAAGELTPKRLEKVTLIVYPQIVTYRRFTKKNITLRMKNTKKKLKGQ